MKSHQIFLVGAVAIVFAAVNLFGQNPTGVLPPRSVAAPSEPNSPGGGISSQRLQRIGQLIDRRIAAKDISGAVTLVAQRGRIIYFEARGLMDIEAKKPMARDSLFDIASMTKPITTVALLMLAEDGKLHLTDPVSRFIPSFKNPTVKSETDLQPVAANRDITIHDVLTHTSGIVSAPRIPRDPAETLARYIPTFAAGPLEFQPGTRWVYSNTVGFDTLARIVEIASGESFDGFLRQRIFMPLGMKDTGYRLDSAKSARLAANYRATPDGLRRQQFEDPPEYFGGGWGLKSTAEDYFRFAQMLTNRGELDGKRLLGSRSIDLMSSVHIPDTLPGRQPGEGWGLGVRVITDLAARDTLLSNGNFGWGGAFGTRFWVDPSKGLVAILMVQTPAVDLGVDFDTAVMQAVVGD